MVEQLLPFFENIFSNCAEWTSKLLDAVGGKGVVLAAFCIVLAISLLIIPMRGPGLAHSLEGFSDFTKQVTYKGKYSNGKVVRGNSEYKGKYEKRAQGGHRASPKN